MTPTCESGRFDLYGFEVGNNELTPSEERVVACLMEAMANSEIAARLGIAVDTVKHHLTNVKLKWNIDVEKYDLRNRIFYLNCLRSGRLPRKASRAVFQR